MTLVKIVGGAGSGKSYILEMAALGLAPKRSWWKFWAPKAQRLQILSVATSTPHSRLGHVNASVTAGQRFVFFDEGTEDFCTWIADQTRTMRVIIVVAGEYLG